jgi:hypothetical protein
MNLSDIPQLDARGFRQFGLTTGGLVAVLFGVVFPYLFGAGWPLWPWIVFAVLATWALVAPMTLQPLYRGWMRVGLALSKVTTPIIMTLVFLVAILPGAILLRLLGKDPMRRKKEPAESYRVPSRGISAKNLEKPF